MTVTLNDNSNGMNGRTKNDIEDVKVFLTSAKRNLETARRTFSEYPEVAKNEIMNARRSINTAFRLMKSKSVFD